MRFVVNGPGVVVGRNVRERTGRPFGVGLSGGPLGNNVSEVQIFEREIGKGCRWWRVMLKRVGKTLLGVRLPAAVVVSKW
jgi:hypothetical protein